MRNRFAYAVAGLLALMPGCLYRSQYPNGYYGTQPVMMPGQPYGYPSGPLYQQPAGAPYYQPGVTQPTPINGGNPPTSNPIDLNNQNPPSTYGSGGNNAPTFNPTPNNNNPGGGGTGGVPQPGDDGNSDFNRGTNRNPLTPTTSATTANDAAAFAQQDSRLPRDFADDSADNSASPFEPPVKQSGGKGNIQQVNGQSDTARPGKTYDHHPKFSWVQGVVEYDEPSKMWVVMYDDNPGTSDPFGGELTIGGDLTNAHLRSGDVVRIVGNLDPIQEDARGKPIYQATKLQKL